MKQLQEEMDQLKKQLEGQEKAAGDGDKSNEEYEKVGIHYCMTDYITPLPYLEYQIYTPD